MNNNRVSVVQIVDTAMDYVNIFLFVIKIKCYAWKLLRVQLKTTFAPPEISVLFISNVVVNTNMYLFRNKITFVIVIKWWNLRSRAFFMQSS